MKFELKIDCILNSFLHVKMEDLKLDRRKNKSINKLMKKGKLYLLITRKV